MENKKKTNKISVIVPCWNYGMFLRQCLDSILSQTIVPYHIIFADDHSTDDSNAIAWDYLRRIHNKEIEGMLTIDRRDERLGTIKNENLAADIVGTEWFFFLDADDYIDPTYIEKGLAIIEANDSKLAVVYSDMEKVGNWSGVWETSNWNPEELRKGNYINGHAFIRTSMFKEIGGLKDNGNFEDHQMWVDMIDLHKGYYGIRIPEPLVKYRRHDFGHRTDKSDIDKRSNL